MKFIVIIILVFVSLVSVSYAEVVDLRSKMTKTKSQGERNTCSVFAATALMEFLLFEKNEKTVDLSEQFLYWSAKTNSLKSDMLKSFHLNNDSLAGFLAVETLISGVALESSWPYESKNWLQTSNQKCTKVAGSELYKSECFTGIPPKNIEIERYKVAVTYMSLKNIPKFILSNKRPVLVNVFWYNKLVDKFGNFIRLPTDKEKQACLENGQNCSGHVILLVGYDSKSKRYIFRNSWGSEWGNNGYGTISEEFVTLNCEVCHHLKNNFSGLNEEQIMYVKKAASGVSASIDFR